MRETLFYTAAAEFQSARQLPDFTATHPLGRIHGHSFHTRLRIKAENSAFPLACASLREQLAQSVAPLDYDFLNNHLDNPNDAELARWIQKRSGVNGIDLVGVQSTTNQGTDIDKDGVAHRWRRYRFEAAHQLPNVPPDHQCGRMHGHGFEVILHADSSAGDTPADYVELDENWAPVAEALDHRCLNDIPGLENPTSEMLCQWIWQRIKPALPSLSWVTVYETVTAGCHYDGQHFRIWKEQRFESALAIEKSSKPALQRLHGHSYLIRLHLCAELDPVLGWTVDYGDVKQLFAPTYAVLDHHLLNDLPGLTQPDTASVTRWIRGQISEQLPALDRIDLYQQPGCGVILNWGERGPALPI